MGEAHPALPARQPLAARWEFCGAEPGGTEAAPQDGWQASSCAQTVAAALRELGQWSLDAPPRDFDAQDWWFRARFDRPGVAAARLGFDGLATRAQVWLNGRPLLWSDNMFVAHEAAVADLLNERDNELLLRFAALAPELDRRRPRPRWRTPMVAHQQLRWQRTTLLGRTPGWSPPAAPVGPWRGIWWSDGAALQPSLRASLVDGRGRCELRLRPPTSWSRDLESAELVLHAPEGRCHAQTLVRGATAHEAVAIVEVAQPALWWPHTHGEAALYRAGLRLVARDGTRQELPLGSVGFRRIEVDRSRGGFQLRVNGAPVFCRGAGWTPLDVVSLRSTPQACESALRQVRDAGMNMLRLAGTLVYEEDHFYRACDALGLLVWQDFMFANMDYPFGEEGFAAGAVAEARQQLQRLAPHPSVAVLCGNSEVEQQAAMWGAPRDTWQPAFFHQVLPALCGQLAPEAVYWPSSAHGGAFPHQAGAGTTSYYGVGAYERGLDDARRSGLRFATECLAFANIPSPSALERLPGGLATRVHHPAWKQRSPRDLGAGWDFDDVRDHYVRELFGVDPARLRHSDHDRYLAFGRLATAEVMAAAYSEWRRPGSSCDGALLLLLRDLWAGAGWGVLDDTGQPKASWQALRRVLQPLAVLVTDEGGDGLVAHVVNETPHAHAASLELSAWRDGQVLVASGRRPLDLAPRTGCSVALAELLEHFLDLNHAWRFGPPACELVRVRLLDAQGGELARALHFPIGLAPLLAARPAADIGLTARLSLHGDDEAVLAVACRQWAIDVHLDVPGWLPDDDHFHLAPGESRELRLRRSKPGAALAGSLHALNLSTGVPVDAPA
ncbi:MAG TPA: glycoside hydrolase family 2 protein [Ramlibacter sp.]|jgi:beta-mannosidase|uniref:glycosyl hydrolase 2 galactose-binding domain-containing protein n=1 Tax=Ramlibacter sp. TaxID=1917967 RepID=UPI002D309D38|nr:glycoside hydrolase family 2 protein [Ramlibacter sp.]HZY19057.1 glycoside hydrolase family 2 protein [Ramlibacter sp.]